MKTLWVILGIGFQVWLVRAEPGPAVSLEQRTQSFAIILKGSVAEVTPLFGPVGEVEWSPSWAPLWAPTHSGAPNRPATADHQPHQRLPAERDSPRGKH